MTPTQCVELCKFIADRCPAMRMQDGTPDAWYVDLRDYDLDVAAEAARQATIDQTFIGIGDLIRGCERIVQREAGARRRAELDAQIEAENPGEITQRDLPALIVGQPMPNNDQIRAERRRMLQAAAHTKREHVEADTAQRQAERERMEQARAELDVLRQPAERSHREEPQEAP